MTSPRVGPASGQSNVTSVEFMQVSNPPRTSCCELFVNKLKSVTSSVFNAISELWTPAKPAYERFPGEWYNAGFINRTDTFGALMPDYSQREDWYAVTPYISEFWCCGSNAGFLYVGYKHRSPEFLIAGAASVASHAVPRQWLLTADKIGAAIAAIKIIRSYKALRIKPWLLVPMALVGGIFLADVFLSQTFHFNWLHPLWHISAACGSNMFLNVHQLAVQSPLIAP
jgi:hypothetical protein